MTFTEKDKMKALAIVHVFETGKPFGDYAACVVLNDGAGISYGINQFTHRSGSLAAVIKTYLRGGQVGRELMTSKLSILNDRSAAAIQRLSADLAFQRVLRAAATTEEMRAAQREIAYTRYLRPALEICERMELSNTLSLAVVYDSVTHGSWDWIAARVNAVVRPTSSGSPVNEKAWITEYVRRRHRWLTEIRRLRVTNYRTRFFLDQIAIGNWGLKLPLNVHGVRLSDQMFENYESSVRVTEVVPAAETTATPPLTEKKTEETLSDPEPQDPFGASASEIAAAAVQGFDRLDGAIATVARRTDSAKSMWTAIGGTVSQAAWAVFGFIVGLPREVWIFVALIAAALTLLYLYRQIVLGRIREVAGSQ